ncbi:MAG: alpha/beta hydrolase-fold protein, partial [Bacteroidetes bacterium]|nr:alpha/beta hydrolase-fold protein [Bacteroidota bacterium]
MRRSGILFLLLVQLMFSQTKRVTVVVEPAVTAQDSDLTVYITGNSVSMGNWNPAAVPLRKESESLWSINILCDSGSTAEFKITAGSWDSEALYDSGSTPSNTIIDITKDTSVILRPLFWKRYILPNKPEPMIRGTVHYHRQLMGNGLNHRRDIIVWLPPTYEKNLKKHFPVLYMHDGQNIFDPSTAFTGYDWRVDEVADSLIKMKKIEETIIVGIYNSPDRLPEYSDSPLGTAYMEFVVNVVKPLIDSTYRTKPGREYTGIAGSSLGGLSSLLFVW